MYAMLSRRHFAVFISCCPHRSCIGVRDRAPHSFCIPSCDCSTSLGWKRFIGGICVSLLEACNMQNSGLPLMPCPFYRCISCESHLPSQCSTVHRCLVCIQTNSQGCRRWLSVDFKTESCGFGENSVCGFHKPGEADMHSRPLRIVW